VRTITRAFRPNENIDDVVSTLVHKRTYAVIADVVQPPSHQSEILVRKIAHRRSKIQLSVKPGLHGVLITGLHIEKVPRLHRADVTRHDFLGNEIVS
jgi:hypothetical protein